MWFARFDPLPTPVAAWAARLRAPVFAAEEGRESCAYAHALDEAGPVPVGVAAVRLEPLQLLAGASPEAPVRWHYVVATDVLPDQEDEFNRWYEQEHLPGLAAVPGVVRAARYRVTEGVGPRYHACYDLADRAAFNGPAWLAVRGTDWSSRVRPAFLNTRRTMYALPSTGI